MLFDSHLDIDREESDGCDCLQESQLCHPQVNRAAGSLDTVGVGGGVGCVAQPITTAAPSPGMPKRASWADTHDDDGWSDRVTEQPRRARKLKNPSRVRRRRSAAAVQRVVADTSSAAGVEWRPPMPSDKV